MKVYSLVDLLLCPPTTVDSKPVASFASAPPALPPPITADLTPVAMLSG